MNLKSPLVSRKEGCLYGINLVLTAWLDEVEGERRGVRVRITSLETISFPHDGQPLHIILQLTGGTTGGRDGDLYDLQEVASR